MTDRKVTAGRGLDYGRRPVVIVGAGPVGLTLANLLGGFGVETLVLERNRELPDFPRAVGADDLAFRAWQACGLLEEILPDVIPLGASGCGLTYFTERRRILMEWRPESAEFGYTRGGTLIQGALEAVLRRGLGRFPQVGLRMGHQAERLTVETDRVVLSGATAEGRAFEVAGDYLVGCDGGGSLVRRSIGAVMPGTTGPEEWLIVDTVDPLQSEADCRQVSIFCDAARTVVRVPRRRGHCRWEFVRRRDESEDALLRDETIRDLITAYGGRPEVEIGRRLLYRFSARNASRYRRGRALICGDAAHVTPPYAAQGLACGIGDALGLAWRLTAALRCGAGGGLLESYQQERRHAAASALRLSRMIGRLMLPRGPAEAWLRNRVLGGLYRIPAVGRRIRSQAFRFPRRHRSDLVLAGGRSGWNLPQPRVRLPDGAVVPLDLALGPWFCLLWLGPATVRDALWQRLGASRLVLLPRGSRPRDGEAEDLENGIFGWVRGPLPRCLVVRPDRVVAIDCRPLALAAKSREFARAIAL